MRRVYDRRRHSEVWKRLRSIFYPFLPPSTRDRVRFPTHIHPHHHTSGTRVDIEIRDDLPDPSDSGTHLLDVLNLLISMI